LERRKPTGKIFSLKTSHLVEHICMSTSQTSGLSKPTGSEKVSIGTLGYVRTRARQRVYNLVLKELKKSGVTQADLARRLDKGPDAICRLLARPGNWELDTLSDLLFGISGSTPTFSVDYPLDQRPAVIFKTIDKGTSDQVAELPPANNFLFHKAVPAMAAA
jgi:hypothetical protein